MQQPENILEENQRLRIRLQQSEDIVRALRAGTVEALVDQNAAAEANPSCDSVLAQLADAVIAVDETDHIVYLNAASELLYGIAASDALGRPLADVFTTSWVESNDEAAAKEALREHGEWCGEIIHVAHDARELDVECRITALKNNLGQPNGRVAVIRDVSKRRQHDQRVPVSEIRYRRLFEAARASDDRQAFLLKLSDTLRPIGDALEIQSAALQVLGEHLAVNRAFFNEIAADHDGFVIHRTYANGVAPLVGHFRLNDLKWTAELAESGQIGVIDDASADPRLSEVERATYAAMEVAAGIGVPLIKDGRWVAGLGVHQATPRHWTPGDIELVREVAERTWAAVERAKAETALHDREADLARVQRIGRVGGVNIVVAPELRSMRSPEYLRLHGLPLSASDESHADWLARVLPMDRERAERAILTALNGNAVTYESEYRIVRPSDGAVRWIEARADIERDANGTALRLVGAHVDITEQKLLQQALTASDARQAFLLKFSDALRSLGDPVEVQTAALRVLGEHLGAGRAQYWQVEPDGQHAHSAGGYSSEGPYVSGLLRLNDFGIHLIETLAAGLTLVVRDITTDPLASEEVLAAYDAIGVRAFITVPLLKSGRLIALLTIHHAGARDWTLPEIALVEDAADRTWAAVERAQAEAELRERQHFHSRILEVLPGVLYVFDLDENRAVFVNNTAKMTYSPDEIAAMGVDLVRNLMHPDDQPGFHDHIACIRTLGPGETATFEYRMRDKAGKWRWYMGTDTVFLRDETGVALQFIGVAPEITDRKIAEAALSENARKQMFLLRLSDALRAEPSAKAMTDRALQMLF